MIMDYAAKMGEAWQKSDIAVNDYQLSNLKNWHLLTGSSKKKLALPLTLRLRKDWGQYLPKKEASAESNWVKVQMLWHYRCNAYDTQGQLHDLAFAFNLEELVRQIACIAFLVDDQNPIIPKEMRPNIPVFWLNPVTQEEWTGNDIKDMQEAYMKGKRELDNQLTLAERYAPYVGYAGIAATLGAVVVGWLLPAYVGTLITLKVLTWALPLAKSLVAAGDRWLHRYDRMSMEQKRDWILSLQSVAALGAASCPETVSRLESVCYTSDFWLDKGIYGRLGNYTIISLLVSFGSCTLIAYLRNKALKESLSGAAKNAFNRSLARKISADEFRRHRDSGGAVTEEDFRTNIRTAVLITRPKVNRLATAVVLRRGLEQCQRPPAARKEGPCQARAKKGP